ncbi:MULTISPECIES: thiol:disulfide interchange protein DsbA/DsbL [Aliiglaciecola]|uniref:thiol:disulfide interchange protein DsbA/DsbL n=1 Tax=Aliiglaciecola TaxID=1406885 RepID=UPI001C099FF3|nr:MULTISPECIES: thiol:disulfide interchange protein DsbA/DsbL [Aliiglaciecola]MBU2877295.1 thiol:disulfide interchange protein DsbA/DsbL [Aliiglaciecola lipolytica]MDO6712004.1 thiol:disulfide interchange protein DsbA/DsbL [Aliiglaciecola sp. 2_MG-2023]MDO6753632.1 thiol:disulfide interchange protein DsbA/DsbL [Aliiglaciecola sp. 1_MG-2023]
MIFKLTRNLLIAFVCAVPTLAMAQSKWEEGEHYTVLKEIPSETKQVREVFSFWCPHCFTFESIAKDLKSKLPSDVTFTKAHVNFMGGAEKDTQNAATKAMLAARQLGKADEFNTALFTAIHKDRKNIASMEDILKVYAEAGGDSDKLKKLANSYGIRGAVRKNDKLTLGVRSVPTFIVNDKYQAIFGSKMTPNEFVELITWLTTQK